MAAEGAFEHVTNLHRYRLDDLRRSSPRPWRRAWNVVPARASSLAARLLWFDAAGAHKLGIAALPAMLDQFESKSIDPKSEPTIVSERGSTAVVDGRQGVPLLALDRAGALATEKARDTGLGLVRVRNIKAPGSAAGIAAEMAIGPVAGLILGPGPCWSVALPAEGLPGVFDPALGEPGKPGGARALNDLISPWANVLAPEGGWLVAAISVPALEPLSSFHERVAETLKGLDEAAGRLLPARWEAHRQQVREHGMGIEPAAWNARPAIRWSGRLPPIEPPAPLG